MQNADTDLCSFTPYRNLLIFAYLLMCFVFLLLPSGYDALPTLQGLLKLNSLISGIS